MDGKQQADLWTLSDLCTPWCVHVLVTLRIADHIAAGITRIDELASVSGSHCESLHRVLRHMVEKGVFEEPRLVSLHSTSLDAGSCSPARSLGST